MNDYDEQAQRYLILIQGGPPSNYSAWSPDLPGCVATGTSLETVEREMRAAIALHLEGIVGRRGDSGTLGPRACTSSASHAPPRSSSSESVRFEWFAPLACVRGLGCKTKAASSPPSKKHLQISYGAGGLEPPTSWVRSRRSPS